VGFIADINASGIAMDHLQAEVLTLDQPYHLSSLLAIHLRPLARRRAAGRFPGFLLWLGFHANLPMLNSTWLGPVGETYTISPAGSGLYPFHDKAATIYTIANMVGQERSKEKTALAAEPRCASDSRLNFVRQPSSSRREFQSHITTPEGWPLLMVDLRFLTAPDFPYPNTYQ
jgi:hypothetical protein